MYRDWASREVSFAVVRRANHTRQGDPEKLSDMMPVCAQGHNKRLPIYHVQALWSHCTTILANVLFLEHGVREAWWRLGRQLPHSAGLDSECRH